MIRAHSWKVPIKLYGILLDKWPCLTLYNIVELLSSGAFSGCHLHVKLFILLYMWALQPVESITQAQAPQPDAHTATPGISPECTEATVIRSAGSLDRHFTVWSAWCGM